MELFRKETKITKNLHVVTSEQKNGEGLPKWYKSDLINREKKAVSLTSFDLDNANKNHMLLVTYEQSKRFLKRNRLFFIMLLFFSVTTSGNCTLLYLLDHLSLFAVILNWCSTAFIITILIKNKIYKKIT